MKNQKLIQTLTLLALLALVPSCQQPQSAPQAAKSYKSLTIEPSNTTVTSRYTASIRGEQFVDIRPQVSGIITQIAISEGAEITKGQRLFVIDQVPYQAAVASAKAGVASAEASVATAKLNVTSGEELFAEEVISEIELKSLKNTLLAAEASLKLAEASLVNAENNLSYTEVTSPVDGVAGMINYRQGALVSSSIESPLVSVSNNDKMYAYFSISESALLTMIEECGSSSALIEQMDSVKLILNNGRPYSHLGRVDAISGVINTSTGSVGVRASFDNPEQMLRDGGNGSLLITSSYEDVIVVPKIATFEIQNKTFVYKIVDGMTRSAQIDIVQGDNGSEYIVLGGLSLGDEIIAEGAGLMREGTVVKAQKEE